MAEALVEVLLVGLASHRVCFADIHCDDSITVPRGGGLIGGGSYKLEEKAVDADLETQQSEQQASFALFEFRPFLEIAVHAEVRHDLVGLARGTERLSRFAGPVADVVMLTVAAKTDVVPSLKPEGGRG